MGQKEKYKSKLFSNDNKDLLNQMILKSQSINKDSKNKNEPQLNAVVPRQRRDPV